MRLRPAPIKIDADNPFGFDLLGRASIADSLTEILRSSPEGLVLALHAPWGAGKTTFLRMWGQLLKNKGFKTLYFNAWESDFASDALVALVGELEIGLAAMDDKDGQQKSAIATAVKTLKKVTGNIVRHSLPVGLKIATAGIVDLDEVSEESIGDLAQKMAEEQINAYKASRQSIAGFRSAIAAVATAASKPDAEGNSLPLVLFVDELDRCKPSYAVRILECIKHLFAVRGVVFVLSVDRVQLSHAIRSQYGQGIDATGYLSRFFDLELALPDASHQTFSNAQFDRFELGETAKKNGRLIGGATGFGRLQEVFPYLFRSFSCSLRERERCFSVLSFAFRATPGHVSMNPFLLATFIVLRVKDPDLYHRLASQQDGAEEILQRISIGPWGAEFLTTKVGEILEAVLRAAFCPQHDFPLLLQRFEEEARKPGDGVHQRKAQTLCSLLKTQEVIGSLNSVPLMLEKIDFLADNGLER